MLDVQQLQPEAVASPAGLHDHKKFRHEMPHDEDDAHVFLRSSWVVSSLRHPRSRLATCVLRLVACFLACVTAPLAASRQTPGSFPVYSDVVGVLSTRLSVAKLLLHAVLLAIVVAFLRLVVYPLGCEDQWNWWRRHRVARQTFTKLSRSSSITAPPMRDVSSAAGAASQDESTITLRIYQSRANDHAAVRVRVYSTPRAQGSWTLLALLTPLLWWVLVWMLRRIVAGTEYDELFFGESESADQFPQWHVQLVVYKTLMVLNVLSLLLTMDEIFQDSAHCDGLFGHTLRCARRVYSSHGFVRLPLCWLALIALGGGGIYFDLFGHLRTWCLERWSQQASNSPSVVKTLMSESWRTVLSSMVVALDLLWILQDWHFPGFSSAVGVRIFGLHRDFVTISLFKGKKLFFTSKWTSCFVVIGLLLPLDLCSFYQEYMYSPVKYAQVTSITAGYRVFPTANATANESDVIKQLSAQGSIGRFVMQSSLDRVPALICVAMVVAFLFWLREREQWRICYAAFLGRPTRADQVRMTDKINASVPKPTREALKDQMRLYNLYRVRSQWDLLGSCLAIVSVGSVILQVRSIWRTTSANSSVIQATAGETYGVLLVVISVLMVYQIYHRYALKYEILVLRKQIPSSASRWWQGTTRTLLLYPCVLEVLLSGLCLPPFVHGDVQLDEERYFVLASQARNGQLTCPARMVPGVVDSEGFESCDLRYTYPVEVLNLLVLVRLYWLVRLLRNELFRRMFADHAALLVTAGIGRNIPDEISSLRWSFRMSLSLIPGRVIFGIFVILWTGTAAAVSILERPYPSSLDDEEHSLWLTIVTISGVGYGDAYPLTAFGRLSIIVGAVLGGAVVVSLMTSIFLDTLKGSKDEHRFVQQLERITWDKQLQQLSAELIAAAWKAHRQHKSPVKDRVFQLAHEFKTARKLHRPKETFESLEQLRISYIAKWRSKQMSDWVDESSKQRDQLVQLVETEVAALEAAMRSFLR